MKRCHLILSLLSCLPWLTSNAQTGGPSNIIIAGGPCINSPLNITTPVPATQITWMLDGGTVVSTQTAAQTSTTTVAGGYGAGAGANQLNSPDRIYVDAYGNIYIPDLANNRVQKWAAGATSGVTVAGGNGSGSAANQFNRPTGVTVDAQGNIYVADQFNERIQKWAPGATSGVTVAGLHSELEDPTDLFMDANGNLYVSNQFAGSVIRYTPDFSSWTMVAGTPNVSGSALSQLSYPTGIFVDAAGNVYVCDTDNNRVMKWAPGATSGVVVAGGSGYGNAASQLANPLDVCVDCQGNLYIADTYNNRVVIWAPGASIGTTILGSGSGSNQVISPASVYLDGNNSVYVSDAGNNRVLQYGSTINRSYTPAAAGTYTATVNTGCGVLTSNAITISNAGPPDLGAGFTLCPGTSAQLDAHAGYQSYQWQDGSVDSVLTVSGPGTYIVTVTSVCGGPWSDTVVVSADRLETGLLPEDTTLCSYDSLLLHPAIDLQAYQWSDGSTGSSIVVNLPGWYWLQGTDQYGCRVADSILVSTKTCPMRGVYVPSAFTPNGDGKNDVFRPQVFGTVINYSFSVFDRYGQMVYSSSEPGAGWDGRVGGHWAGSNVFVWYCAFQLAGRRASVEKGTVVLVK